MSMRERRLGQRLQSPSPQLRLPQPQLATSMLALQLTLLSQKNSPKLLQSLWQHRSQSPLRRRYQLPRPSLRPRLRQKLHILKILLNLQLLPRRHHRRRIWKMTTSFQPTMQQQRPHPPPCAPLAFLRHALPG